VRRSASSEEEAAEEGMLLSSGDTIKTGAGSYAELAFDDEDKNVVRVEEGSTSVVLLKEDQKIELLEGEVFSVIRGLPPGRSFEVVTPTAVAGARGTEWVTRYANEATEVEAYDDEPFVKMIDAKGNMGEETRVKPGFATHVARFRPPTAPVQIPAARQQRWQNMRQAVQQRVQDVRERRGRPDRAAFAFQEKAARLNKGAGDRKLLSGGLKQKSVDAAGSLREKVRQGVSEVKKDPGLIGGLKDLGANKTKGVVKETASGAVGQAKNSQPANQSVDKKPVVANKVADRFQALAAKASPAQKNISKATGGSINRAVKK
jgi:hypothetical protein